MEIPFVREVYKAITSGAGSSRRGKRYNGGVDLRIRFLANADVPREVIEDALKDALEDAGTPKGKGPDILFSLNDLAPEDKILEVVRLTLQLVGVARARITLGGTEYRYP